MSKKWEEPRKEIGRILKKTLGKQFQKGNNLPVHTKMLSDATAIMIIQNVYGKLEWNKFILVQNNLKSTHTMTPQSI